MSWIICPECGHQNSPNRITCKKCRICLQELDDLQEINDRYVDCYECDGTGEIILEYTAEYAHEIQNKDRTLPCAKCHRTGKLSFSKVQLDAAKRIWKWWFRGRPPWPPW